MWNSAKLIILQISLICAASPLYADMIADSHRYIRQMKAGGFSGAISSGAIVTLLYQDKGHMILFFDNAPPDTGHENYAVVIFKNYRFAYSYSSEAVHCYVVAGRLRARERFEKFDDITDVPIVDLFSGKRALIGGQLVSPGGPDPVGGRWLRRRGL